MSYCRWSSDGYQCDVYVYQSESGYETYVASRRRPQRIPDLRMTSPMDIEDSIRAQRAALIDPANVPQPIGLSEDGASFNHETPRECAENLIRLKGLGYLVPQEAIEALMEEGGTT